MSFGSVSEKQLKKKRFGKENLSYSISHVRHVLFGVVFIPSNGSVLGTHAGERGFHWSDGDRFGFATFNVWNNLSGSS